jgi:hypothetical protein
MKIIALALASQRQGLSRYGGGILVALYLIFAAIIIFWN